MYLTTQPSKEIPVAEIPEPSAHPPVDALNNSALFKNGETLKIAALVDTSIISGPGRQLVALAQGLKERHVHMRVFLLQRRGRPLSPFISYLERAGIDHQVLEDRGPLDVQVLFDLRRALIQWRPHIVQSHGYRHNVMSLLMRLGKPTWSWVAFSHGATDEDWKVKLYNRLDRAAMPRADRLVVMSQKHLNEFRSMGDRASVIYNAVLDLPTELEPVVVRRRSGLPTVGVVGRLSPEKGVDVFLQAIARLDPCTVSVVIAGDGPERTALEKQAASLGIAQDVEFLGAVRNVNSLYSQLDLVVLPSRSEGLPNVLLEALKADVPVVATAVGGVPEVLRVPDAGAVVPPCDPAALATAIAGVLANGRTDAAKAARAEAAEAFSLKRRVEAHLALYKDVLTSKQIARRLTGS